MRKMIVKRLLFLLKIALSVGILYFVFRKIDFHVLATNLSSYSVAVLTMLLVTSAIKHVTQFYNWYWYLSINPAYHPNRLEVLKSYFIGLALGFVVPGGYATFGKMFYVENRKKATAVSVGVEKFYQTWIVLFFASISIYFYFTEVRLIWKILAFAIVIAMPFLLPLVLRLLRKKSEYPGRLYSITPRIIASQAVYMLITFYQYFILLSNQISPTDTTIISLFSTSIGVSLILTVTLIGITYSGLGMRETAAIFILARFGIDSETAVAASLAIFIFNAVLPAIAGAWLIFAQKKRLPNSRANSRSDS